MDRFSLEHIEAQLGAHQPLPIDAQTAPQRAAVAIVLRPGEPGGWELLYIQRATHPEDPWSGHMAFPGGRLDPQDSSALAAAVRETREEVGLDLQSDARLLGQLDDTRSSAGGRVLPLAISPFVFLLTDRPALRCNHEVQKALWVPLDRLLDPASASTLPYTLGGQRYDLPCFDIDGQIIWGLTYLMTMRFFALLDWQVGEQVSAP